MLATRSAGGGLEGSRVAWATDRLTRHLTRRGAKQQNVANTSVRQMREKEETSNQVASSNAAETDRERGRGDWAGTGTCLRAHTTTTRLPPAPAARINPLCTRRRSCRSRQTTIRAFFAHTTLASFPLPSPFLRLGLRWACTCSRLVPDVSERLVDGVHHHRHGEAGSLVQLVPHLVASKNLLSFDVGDEPIRVRGSSEVEQGERCQRF